MSLPFPWKQGEHMNVVGDTGTGKTTLCARLILERQFVLSLRTKADDTKLPGKVVKTANAWRKLLPENDPRTLLYPTYERQGPEIYSALETTWKEGGWCVYFDELYYLTSQIRGWSPHIERQINRMLTQGRSMKLTALTGMQRPVLTTRFAMSQATHLIAFRVEGRDRRTLQDVASDEWSDAVAGLGAYEFAWFHRPSRGIWIGKVQDLPPVDAPGA